MRVKKLIAICLLISILVLSLVGCNPTADIEKARGLAEELIDMAIVNDFDSAYATMSDVCTEDEFRVFWEKFAKFFESTESYDLTVTNWNKTLSVGVVYTSIIFYVTKDDGKKCQLAVTTAPIYEGIAGIDFYPTVTDDEVSSDTQDKF